MRRDALDLYVCPACRGALRLDVRKQSGAVILEGTLGCPACPATYPITRGVPRFVPAAGYAASFGRQWNWFRTVQLDSHTGREDSLRAFRGTTGWTDEDLQGRLVLDAGVGAGRFAECAARAGGVVFGVDLTNAVDAAYANIGHYRNVHLAQADIFALPFRDASFDRVYSIGVLHHTPDPPAAFARLSRTVREDGELAIYVYARYGPDYRVSDVLRRITTRLPPRLLLAACAAAVPLYFVYRLPVLGRLFAFALPISEEPDWRWRWLDTFDWYSPRYQFKYLYPEVSRWFRANGFEDLELFDEPIRMKGRRLGEVSRAAGQPVGRLVAS